jgi:hypothetical protein
MATQREKDFSLSRRCQRPTRRDAISIEKEIKMSITVSTTQYQFSHGKHPRGQGYWGFKLCTDNSSEIFWSNPCQQYSSALKDARTLAVSRRAHTIVVMP